MGDELSSPLAKNPYGYSGYYWDAETYGLLGKDNGALYHVRHRVYDPVAGRWLTRDPAGFVDGMNVYEYVGGRAVAGVDPYGLWLHLVIGGAVGAAGGAIVAAVKGDDVLIGAAIGLGTDVYAASGAGLIALAARGALGAAAGSITNDVAQEAMRGEVTTAKESIESIDIQMALISAALGAVGGTAEAGFDALGKALAEAAQGASNHTMQYAADAGAIAMSHGASQEIGDKVTKQLVRIAQEQGSAEDKAKALTKMLNDLGISPTEESLDTLIEIINHEQEKEGKAKEEDRKSPGSSPAESRAGGSSGPADKCD